MSRMEWEDYLKDIQAIEKFSNGIGDLWQVICVNNDPCGSYLCKKFVTEINLVEDEQSADIDFEEDIAVAHNDLMSTSLNNNKELVSFDFHVLYHLSYGVPYICFNVYKSSGSMVSLDEAWKMFNDPVLGKNGHKSMPMTTILTQMEHPLEFKPYLTLHPCQTAELLDNLPNSKNKVFSFLSSIGPAVNLSLDTKYGNLN